MIGNQDGSPINGHQIDMANLGILGILLLHTPFIVAYLVVYIYI